MDYETVKLLADSNDQFRKTFTGGAVYLTNGVNNLDIFTRSRVLRLVQEFKDFSPENDPYGEHDFGQFQLEGQGYIWKIDYYDQSFRNYQKGGNKVLTIMKAEEY